MSLDSFKCRKTLKVGAKTYTYFSLKAAEKNGLKGVTRLPYSLKVLLENLLRFEDGRISPVPLQWTDVVVPDFAVVAGSGLALCGFADLLELARLVEGLVARERAAKPKSRKDNYAAHVKQITQRSPWSLR